MQSRRLLSTWLATAALFAFSLIVLGGVVRLTRAGLSITEWRPITGALPPMGESEWAAEFDKYKSTPEYTQVNAGMDLAGFKTIFLLEYAHRLLGRVTGLLLAVPLLYWLIRRKLSIQEARPIFYVLIAGVGQAVLGWLMVQSGLIDVPHVSPHRLAAHLVVGIGLFAALVWMIVGRLPITTKAIKPSTRTLGIVTLMVATLTVAWGGLMAGTHAGLLFPTFPKMAGQWLPTDLASSPHAIASDMVMIHFTHRALALLLTVACMAFVVSSWRVSPRARTFGATILAVLCAQIGLGAWVVLARVPIALASLHQANAVILVGLLTALVAETNTAQATVALHVTASSPAQSPVPLKT
jgi:heme a synthase